MSRLLAPAPEPITEDDAFIARAVERASLPTLMMSMIHISGDTSLLRGSVNPGRAAFGDLQGHVSDEQRAQVNADAVEILKAYRDAGCPPPPAPSHETIHEMMSFMVGEPVPADYVPMMIEELSLDGADARDVHLETLTAEQRERFFVLVIGAGMSGLLTGIRLQEAGIPYVIIEKNDSVGGTWYENSYPGCRVDVANHFYCYSFEPNHDWSEFFSQRDELHQYFERCADKYKLREHIRLETEVVSAGYDEPSASWNVRVRGKQGEEETLRANVIVSAVGQLNRSKTPDIPGRDGFRGPAFHSSHWQHEHDLAGKRVAVIGTGASAFQLVPEVAKKAEQLFVFQRSPGWMLPNPHYHSRVSDEKKWLLRHVPFYARWYRFLLFWPGSDGLMPSLIVDPDWPHPERSVNALNDAYRVHLTQYYESEVGDEPELLEKVLPKYPPFGKRILQDNGTWLSTLKRDNVELVSDGIERITADGVVTVDGKERAVDVIVFATGFHANRFLWPIDIVGRSGATLGEVWGDDPKAYLGMTVPDFPNLFCLYGPATNLAHAGSIIFHSECQVRYITGCIRAMLERDVSAMECKREVHDAFNEKLQQTAAKTVWSHPGVTSWYKNSQGRVTTTSPWLLRDYWRWTREPDLDEYELL